MSTKKEIFNSAAAVNGLLVIKAGRATVNVTNLATTEAVDVEIPKNDDPDVSNDSHWETLYLDGSAVQFIFQSKNSYLLIGPNTYRFKKASTAGIVFCEAYGEYIE